MNAREITDVELMALADGELAEPEAQAVRVALLSDPKLARRFELFVASRRVLGQAFAEADRAPVPARLLAAARGPAATRLPARRRWSVAGLALAASMVTAIGLTVMSNRTAGPSSQGVVAALTRAAPALGGALNGHPSGDVASIDVAGGPYEIVPIASFETRGRSCREFQGSRPDGAEPVQGVACLEGGGWNFEVLTARVDDPVAAAGGFTPASGSTPLASRYPDARRLTPGEEKEAIRKGWKR